VVLVIFTKKNSSFRLPYQCPSSSADCARELFNGSNGSASLVDCTRKKNFCLGGAGFFCSHRVKDDMELLKWSEDGKSIIIKHCDFKIILHKSSILETLQPTHRFQIVLGGNHSGGSCSHTILWHGCSHNHC